jgi:hypothetical protein
MRRRYETSPQERNRPVETLPVLVSALPVQSHFGRIPCESEPHFNSRRPKTRNGSVLFRREGGFDGGDHFG